MNDPGVAAPGDAGLAPILARWRAGAASAEITLMEVLIRSEDLELARAAVTGIPALAALLEANASGCARICAMLRSGVDEGGAPAASVAAGIASARRLFDWSVQEDEAASVALYSLGNPEILARATDEVIALLAGWDLLEPDARVLELGCGTGRFLAPLAARVATVVGVDVAPRMIEAAARRVRDLPGVSVRVVDGRDLAGFADASFEVVLAVDSFPYIVQAGAALAQTLFGEARRVLAPGGHAALFNYSYRGDDARDRADVQAAAASCGFEVLVGGTRPFRLWNGLAFLLRAQPTPSSRR